ncbi:MAG: hypothetical protein JNM14_13810 [Ferruginibacter sp.]|nr:hypothetical protein [Ferruginibacter sp.]
MLRNMPAGRQGAKVAPAALLSHHIKANILTIFPHQKSVQLNYLLFAVYLVILCSLMLRVPFIKNCGINSGTLLTLFLIKILAGIAIGWISIHIYGPGNDYWDVNDFAREEYQLLHTNPGRYFINIFTSDYQGGYAGMFSSGDSYWNDLKGNIVIKLVSIFNIFSRGDYYINSLFFNFIIFFGHIILYRLFIKLFPGKQLWVIVGCFLLPSMLYFSSGIHKDGVVFLMMAVIVYTVYQSLLKNAFSVKRILLISVSLALLFLVRNFVLLALLPALFAWILSAKTKWNAAIVFTAVYALSALIFFNISSINPEINPPAIITEKQAAYRSLPVAATQIELTPLQPTFKGFAANAPQASMHVLLLPYPGMQPNSLLPFSFELVFYIFLLLRLFFFWRKKDIISDKAFLFFLLFFTFTVFLFIGYIVPNIGSLVRYRSLLLPLIITPLLCSIGWKSLKKINEL